MARKFQAADPVGKSAFRTEWEGASVPAFGKRRTRKLTLPKLRTKARGKRRG